MRRNGSCAATPELSSASLNFVDSSQLGVATWHRAVWANSAKNNQVTRQDKDGLAEASVIGKWGQVRLDIYCPPYTETKKQLYSSQKRNEKRVHETQGRKKNSPRISDFQNAEHDSCADQGSL